MIYATQIVLFGNYRTIHSSFFSNKTDAMEYARKMAGIVSVMNTVTKERTWLRFKRFFNDCSEQGYVK